MKRISSHKGSALLIVLGMLAFMVVSAVAFSMFMRQSRLPSSFLRQQLTSAQLVKAALAEAMTSIDSAIGDDPAPGVGNSTGRNYWRNRIYMGGANEASAGDTVSTMPLEGLAYLPPPLINTVRHWARRSNTAVWNALGYDAGRYAFTAINVSDYLDINRIHAGLMRDSSPSNRISMAYLFEDENHSSSYADKAKAFEKFIENVSKDSFKTRLVSMADYNLALHSLGGATGFESPFCKYFESGTGDGIFYGEGEKDSIKKQTFVTDSWYPNGNVATNSNALVLSDDTTDAQPFLDSAAGLEPLLKIKTSGSAGLKELRQYLNLAELVALKDYVDEDNIPTSLAMPTIERAPMLTGIKLTPADVKLSWETREDTEQVGEESYKYKIWSVKGIGGRLDVGGCAVFPFKRSSALNEKSSYEVQILVRAFFATSESTFAESTRLPGGCSLRPTDKTWKTEASAPKGYWSFAGETSLSIPKERFTEADALCNIDTTSVSLDIDFGNALDAYGIKYKAGDESSYVADVSHMDEMHVLPYRTSDNNELKNVRGIVLGNGEASFDLILLTYIRIVGDDGTVDMFPATLDDDDTYNGLSGQGDLAELAHMPTVEPIVPIRIPGIVTLSKDVFNPGYNPPSEAVAGDPVNLYCNDPRYNWAPEDWYKAENISKTGWLELAKNSMQAHGASDIFQFVSNQGYLQSLGELQFLPMVRTTYQDHDDGSTDGTFFNEGKYGGGEYKTGIDALANREYMWKTMWIDEFPEFTKGQSVKNIPFSAPIEDIRDGSTISPYAADNLLMAAFANTPYDWIIASENDKSFKPEDLDEGLKYCFNDFSNEAEFKWEELAKVATTIRGRLQGSADNWESEWDNWDDWHSGDFFGLNADTLGLHGVDRKFLHSYWKGCFANRQQLFLVFVRAEPSVMGGASAGHTPAQLGARAVALVWREPVCSIETSGSSEDGAAAKPHRMRILFYHQFN